MPLINPSQKGHHLWPADSPEWERTDENGFTEAHFAATSGALPEGFTRWAMADDCGWTVAHQAGAHGHLPADFDQWHLTDNDGTSVAHVAAQHGHLPPGFSHWEMVNETGWTVAHTAARKGNLPPDFNRWFLTSEDGETVAEQLVNSFVIGFFDEDRLRYEAVRLARLPECSHHLVNNPFDLGYPRRKQRLAYCVRLQRELQAAEVVEKTCADMPCPSHTKPRMI